MKIQLSTKPLSDIQNEILVFPIFTEEKEELNDFLNKSELANEFLKENPKFGKPFETQLLYTPQAKILLIGVGKKEKFNFETCQNYAGTAVKSLLGKVKEMILVTPLVCNNLSEEQIIYALGLGAEIAAHDSSLAYKSEKEEIKLKTLQIQIDKNQNNFQKALKKAAIVAESTNLARMLGDMPANEMTPAYFLEQAKKTAREGKLKITVINEKKAKKLGMGAFCAVSSGSDEPSYIFALEYLGNIRSKEKYGLVGKGLTFDSGGISLKPGSGMNEMKYDMCGAAAVLGTMQAISKLKPKINVVGVCAVTENLPSGKAAKPGDIVKTYSGKTTEILNTDAEGRLVLVDALTFAQKDFKATKLVDLATLTGAMIVALGDHMTGVFGNNADFSQNLINIGKLVGEKYWEMPMDEIYDEMIKSDMADMTNIGHGGSMPGAAGSITGAKFLEQAVKKDTPWIHLDIAPTAWDLKPHPFRFSGATGVGIKTLVELICQE